MNGRGIYGQACSYITVDGNVISGSSLFGVDMSSVSYCVFSNNMVGVNALGDKAVANGESGLSIKGASNVEITDSVLSGNNHEQLYLENVKDLDIHGSLIGTDAYGVHGIQSNLSGVDTFGLFAIDCTNVSISDCVLSGNGGGGLHVFLVHNFYIEKCFIGTDITGLCSISNGSDGIAIYDAENIEIRSCVLSGNRASGLSLEASKGGIVQDCFIGTDSTGVYALPNDYNGITIYDAENIEIRSCVLSGNWASGLSLETSKGGIVQDCFIGTDSTGMYALPNDYHGIYVADSANYMISGGDNYALDNVISGNTYYGIQFSGKNAVDNTVTYNYLGISADGKKSLANKKGNFSAANSAMLSENTTSPNKTTPN